MIGGALVGVDEMAEEIRRSGSVLAPSAFWTDFSVRNREVLADDRGLASFKRNVNHNYFQWVLASPLQPDYRAVLARYARRPTIEPLRARVEDHDVEWFWDQRAGVLPPRLRPRAYALYVALLWEYARRRTGAEVADGLEEPALGRPIAVRHRGRRISQDLGNSLLEYAAVAERVPAARLASPRLIEVGGGYGRLAWLWLTLCPGARVIMVDIPPALALAQHYLTRTLPGRRVAHFRPSADPDQLHAEVCASDLAFLTPNQLEQLPPVGGDLVLNVSSLHEMRPEQVDRYFELFDRHAAGGYLYHKQWRTWSNPADGVTATRESYPYRPSWSVIFDRVHPVQVRFFEALLAL
jgi:putative sugar O-methyltransferase